jgi:hypothetical protein
MSCNARVPMKKLLLCALVAGCYAGKAPATDSFDDLAGLDQKSDAFSAYMKVVATLNPGQSTSVVKWSKTPRYRAVQLNAKGPGTLALTVRSTDGGDALTWLLDAKFHVLGKNDDADDNTLDSHIIHDLPAGGATYWIVFRDYNWDRHNFVVDIAPLKAAATCDVGLDTPDEPSVEVSSMAWLLQSDHGSYQLYDANEPDCLDFSDPAVRAAVAKDALANSGIDWQDATPPVLQGSLKTGAPDFLAALTTARGEMDGWAHSSTPKPAGWDAAYGAVDATQAAIVGDSKTNPSAYFQAHIHVEAEECSQEGWVRVDTRTGAMLILRVHGC